MAYMCHVSVIHKQVWMLAFISFFANKHEQ